MVITRTPLRASFFGGGTDLPGYFVGAGRGAVIGGAIDKYIYVAINRFFSELFDYNLRLAYRISECVQSVEDLQHKPAREILKYFGLVRDVEITVSSDLPAFSGLGSSSAFTVSMIHSVSSFLGIRTDPVTLATTAIDVEQNRLQESVGGQDQTFAAYGGLNLIEFFPNMPPKVTPLQLSASDIALLESSMVLVFTGVKRRANNVEKIKLARMDDIRHLFDQMLVDVDKGLRLFSQPLDLEALGRLLHDSWAKKRALDASVSSPEIDQLYETGIRCGAFGGKVLGAGGGGFVLFLADPKVVPRIRDNLREYLSIDFRFSMMGSTQIL
jgi:D-glycero-alpha-D-manno-heptose-7-phosphate kinase